MIRAERSQPAPQSLAREKTYSGEDVRARLDQDFQGKCYLCEDFFHGQFQIEHLRPKAQFTQHTFNWENLFPAHGDCNNRRLAWPQDGMLDPCVDDVEGRLRQRFVPSAAGDTALDFHPVDPEDAQAANTARELSHIHNANHPHARLLRSRINGVYAYALKLLLDLRQAGEGAERRAVLDQMRPMFADGARFAGVMRSSMAPLMTAQERVDLQW